MRRALRVKLEDSTWVPSDIYTASIWLRLRYFLVTFRYSLRLFLRGTYIHTYRRISYLYRYDVTPIILPIPYHTCIYHYQGSSGRRNKAIDRPLGFYYESPFLPILFMIPILPTIQHLPPHHTFIASMVRPIRTIPLPWPTFDYASILCSVLSGTGIGDNWTFIALCCIALHIIENMPLPYLFFSRRCIWRMTVLTKLLVTTLLYEKM